MTKCHQKCSSIRDPVSTCFFFRKRFSPCCFRVYIYMHAYRIRRGASAADLGKVFRVEMRAAFVVKIHSIIRIFTCSAFCAIKWNSRCFLLSSFWETKHWRASALLFGFDWPLTREQGSFSYGLLRTLLDIWWKIIVKNRNKKKKKKVFSRFENTVWILTMNFFRFFHL